MNLLKLQLENKLMLQTINTVLYSAQTDLNETFISLSAWSNFMLDSYSALPDLPYQLLFLLRHFQKISLSFVWG